MQNTRLTSFDFEDLIEAVDDGAFLFVDPPYFNSDQDKFYTHTFKHDDHLRLCTTLSKNSKRLKFLLTYDNTPEVIELYKWATQVLEKEWNYTINRTDDQTGKTNLNGSRYKGKELFILNYR